MTFVLLGDVMLGRLVNDLLKTEAPAYVWGDTLDLLRSADVRICNLECVISDCGQRCGPRSKTFHFRSDARNIAVLKAAGVDMVALANNHMLDYGCEAMRDMFGLLDRAGIRWAGAGRDAAEAARPAQLRVAGLRIGMLACTDNEPEWEAGDGQPGVYYVPTALSDARTQGLLERVAAARGEFDLLIVSAHWGPNWGFCPAAGHPQLARALIERGADLVYGHSCHVAQGVELYRNRPILYGTGDFIDDYAVNPLQRNDQSFMFFADVEAGRIARLRLVPTTIREFQAHRAKGELRDFMAEHMAALCGDLGTQADWRSEAGYLEIPLTPTPAVSSAAARP